MDSIQKLKIKLSQNIQHLDTKDIKIDAAFFSTEDGFIIAHRKAPNISIEEDKVAAIISALYGICSAGGQEIETSKAKSIMVEYEKSILMLNSFLFDNESFLMALISSKQNNRAQVLFTANNFIKVLQS